MVVLDGSVNAETDGDDVTDIGVQSRHEVLVHLLFVNIKVL